MDKRTEITSAIRADGLGLEIGPSYNPLLPKRAGYDVRVLDHATREELVEKYQAIGLPQEQIDAIEEVDYVWRGQPLPQLVGPDTRFDYIVAAHVIEHTTDFVGFLNDCAEILRPGGVLCLVVPDKRFCFDRMRPLSSLGEVLQAHHDPKSMHPAAPFVDTLAYSVYREGVEPTWTQLTNDRPVLTTAEWSEVRDVVAKVASSESYIDIHRWTFTPASFQLLVLDLVQLGALRVQVDSISETNGFEFYVALRRSSNSAEAIPPSDQRRLDLLMRMEGELCAQAGATHGATPDHENAAMRAELSAVYASTSWRITAPVRAIGARWRSRNQRWRRRRIRKAASTTA